MAWNPYTDQKNRAYSGILTSLFPEQTKTLPRIILWSIVFLLDLILGIVGAFYLGWLQPTAYRSTNSYSLVVGILLAGILGVFWLQGAVWYGIVKYFQRRNQLD